MCNFRAISRSISKCYDWRLFIYELVFARSWCWEGCLLLFQYCYCLLWIVQDITSNRRAFAYNGQDFKKIISLSLVLGVAQKGSRVHLVERCKKDRRTQSFFPQMAFSQLSWPKRRLLLKIWSGSDVQWLKWLFNDSVLQKWSLT